MYRCDRWDGRGCASIVPPVVAGYAGTSTGLIEIDLSVLSVRPLGGMNDIPSDRQEPVRSHVGRLPHLVHGLGPLQDGRDRTTD